MSKRPKRGRPAPSSRSALPGTEVIELEIPSDVRYIEGVVERVARGCEARAFSPRQCHLNVPVALTEALSNAILRGNGGNVALQVLVKATLGAGALIIEVTDEGRGFDMNACTIEPDPADLEREDGRGLFLMRKLMDRVEQVSGGRNTIRMTLHRP